ncbi:MAG TPA: glycosyltransferase family 2 protein [Candidatus Nanoarchaeia archaeon]|nr:glycosyltransferase family 2 protein [Candidatus Nanoarchaeia archaeon]
MALKKVTIIIPTRNEEKHIGNCLRSIFAQDYPKKLLQVIVIDNDSTDKTLEIAKELGAKAIPTNLLNEEIKRSYAIKKYAKGEIIGMVDADNYLPSDKNWLRKMIEPFKDKKIAATDPFRYAYRKQDNLITRYCALIGGDDAIAIYLKLNDHFCYINNTIVGISDKTEDKGDYYEITLNRHKVPALGMNGFFFRKEIFDEEPMESFMHPIFVYRMVQRGHRIIAKVKQEIIHVQPASIRTHFRKKLRRMRRRDSGEMKWDYNYGLTKKDFFLTSLYIMSVLPVIADTIVGFMRKPSSAWLFHPINTFVLFISYVYYVLFKNVRV